MGRTRELGFHQIKDLGGTEGGERYFFLGQPIDEGIGVPAGGETSESALSQSGTMGEAIASDMKFGEGEAPDVSGSAREVFVNREGAPVEAFLSVKNPLGLAGSATGGKERARERRVLCDKMASLFGEVRRGEALEHGVIVELIVRLGKERRCGLGKRGSNYCRWFPGK